VNALGDLSNALIACRKFIAVELERNRQVHALQEAMRLAIVWFAGSFADYFEVLGAQQQLFPAELALARNELLQLTSIVQLYKALGGGSRQEEAAHPDVYVLRREVLDAVVPQQGREVHP
jgi:multidrug efflux system outer membrane protein